MDGENLKDGAFSEEECEPLAEEARELSDEALEGVSGGGTGSPGRCPKCGFVFLGTNEAFQRHIDRCQG